MQLYPALDIRRGRLARAVPPADPLTVARGWKRAGARWLHVVDLDRVVGAGRNDALVQALAALPDVGVQLGGGLVDPGDVAEALDWGARRVVIGAGAMAGLGNLARRVGPQRLAVALDPRGAGAEKLAGVVAAGVRCVVCRALERDGTLAGADLAAAAALVGHQVSVILAGGIASLDELREARRAGIAGVIVGRALHEGRFTIAEALACCG